MTLEDLYFQFEDAVAEHRFDYEVRLANYYASYATNYMFSMWRFQTLYDTMLHMSAQSVDEWAAYNVCAETRPLTNIVVKHALLYCVARDKGIASAILYKLASE